MHSLIQRVVCSLRLSALWSDGCRLEMGPDPTRAYFWPAVNKRPARPPLTQVLFDPTRRIFFWPNGEKLKNLTFLGEIFQIQTQTINGWPDPGQKFTSYFAQWHGVHLSNCFRLSSEGSLLLVFYKVLIIDFVYFRAFPDLLSY